MYVYTMRYEIKLQKVALEIFIFFKQPYHGSFSYLLLKEYSRK
ncbi:hypothetical protein Lbys_0393 [Leadbetterella byssophila DSM 17132]|uniref:Uncharacterized protein n=1 Tax=Leadbetterella byssophila (strain DSM 17132 / JCM 16389 / KACC 11308 / NBRC 106382 / 4M15) TaxID=649349 RepID=E4RW28_LEAB4|nr:hypothetical protein Lbys_0393 [Leadbetterella byssophila DSM 17132]